MKMLTFDPQKRITAAQALKHPFFEGFTHNPAAMSVGLGQSGANKIFDNGSSTNVLGSGSKLPGSRAMRIESRKGILSRKSSVNKNSFYKQKSKDFLPNKLYGSGSPPSNGGMGTIGAKNANRGASSYFNKNGGPMGSAGGNSGLPALNSTKGGVVANNQSQGLGSYGGGGGMGGYNKSPGLGAASGPSFPTYKYGGLGGLGGGIGGSIGGSSGIGGMQGSDPYHPNY